MFTSGIVGSDNLWVVVLVMLGLVVCLVVTEPVVLGVFVTCLFDALVYVFVTTGCVIVGWTGVSTEIGSSLAYVIASTPCGVAAAVCNGANHVPVVGEPKFIAVFLAAALL